MRVRTFPSLATAVAAFATVSAQIAALATATAVAAFATAFAVSTFNDVQWREPW